MRIFKLAGHYDVKEFDGDTGYPPDSGIYFCAIRMKDGTIYYAPNHYDIVLRYRMTMPEVKAQIESIGTLGADGVYMIKDRNPSEYLGPKNNYY